MTDEHILEQLYAPVVTFDNGSKAILALPSEYDAGMMPIVSNVIDPDYFTVSLNVAEIEYKDCDEIGEMIEQGYGGDAILTQTIEQDAGNTYPIVVADVVLNRCTDFGDYVAYLLAFKIGDKQCISAQIESNDVHETNDWTTVFE